MENPCLEEARQKEAGYLDSCSQKNSREQVTRIKGPTNSKKLMHAHWESSPRRQACDGSDW